MESGEPGDIRVALYALSDVLPFLTNLPNSDNTVDKPMEPTTDELIKVLGGCTLGYLLALFGLYSTRVWSSVLSLGEQQRVAFTRLLLSKPQLALLDEATSALDEANEVHLYQKIAAANMTYVNVGHRSSLYDYHNRILRISTYDSNNEQLNWCIEPTRPESYLKSLILRGFRISSYLKFINL